MKKGLVTVPNTFDDQLEGFVGMVKQKGWALTGVDIKSLDADLKAQRDEKQKDMDFKRQADAFHVQFAAAQGKRYSNYMKALEVARAANRDNPDVLKALEQFKRKSAKRAVANPRGNE